MFQTHEPMGCENITFDHLFFRHFVFGPFVYTLHDLAIQGHSKPFNNRHWSRGPGRCWGFVQLGPPQRGPGRVVGGGGGGWEGGVVGGGCCPGPRRRRPRGGPCPPPPTCPYHPTFLSCTAPATDLAMMEVAEHSGLFFVGDVHQIEICKGDNVDAESEIHFAISLPPPVRPTTLWHLLNTAPAWRPPRCE